MNKHIVIGNFISEKEIKEIQEFSGLYHEQDSKIGFTIQSDKKRRKDIFYSEKDNERFDNIIFKKTKPIISSTFNIDIKFRETYKMGRYYGDDQGYYNPHSDTQGGMKHRKISGVICLTDSANYEGGMFEFPDIKKGYRFSKGDAIFFDSNMNHGVNPVTDGLREVVICFFFDDDGHLERLKNNQSVKNMRAKILDKQEEKSIMYKNYIKCKECNSWKQYKNIIDFSKAPNISTPMINSSQSIKKSIPLSYKYKGMMGTQCFIYPILPDSGPGNQIMSIKETLIICCLLGRFCIIPPIRGHYTVKESYYKFSSIFNIRLTNKQSFNMCIIDEQLPHILNDQKNIYSLNRNYHDNVKLKNETIMITHPESKHILLSKDRIYSQGDLEEIKSKKEDILILKHVYNNVVISECRQNGCNNCKLNKNFETIYKTICSGFDYSDIVKKEGDKYIADTFNNKKYISIHMRYPDLIDPNKTLLEYTGGLYDERKIIRYLKSKYGKKYMIFVATNNQEHCKKMGLQDYNFYKPENPLFNWIEQYICCRSNIYFGSPFNDYNKINEPHIRSTWSSFVKDYRNYLLKISSKDTRILTDLFKVSSKKSKKKS